MGAPTRHGKETARSPRSTSFPVAHGLTRDFAFFPMSASPNVRSRVCFPKARRDIPIAQILRADRGRPRARVGHGTVPRERSPTPGAWSWTHLLSEGLLAVRTLAQGVPILDHDLRASTLARYGNVNVLDLGLPRA